MKESPEEILTFGGAGSVTSQLIDVGSGQSLSFDVSPVGCATTACKVQLRDHSNGGWYDYLGGTDFDATDNANMLYASTLGPHETINGGTGWAHVRIHAANAARIVVTASGAGTVTLRATVK